MQVLISKNCFQDLMQFTFSPREILVNLEGNFDRNIFYLTKLETLLIGENEFIPRQLINETILKTLKVSSILEGVLFYLIYRT